MLVVGGGCGILCAFRYVCLLVVCAACSLAVCVLLFWWFVVFCRIGGVGIWFGFDFVWVRLLIVWCMLVVWWLLEW